MASQVYQDRAPAAAPPSLHPMLDDYPKPLGLEARVEFRNLAKKVKWWLRKVSNEKGGVERKIADAQKTLDEINGVVKTAGGNEEVDAAPTKEVEVDGGNKDAEAATTAVERQKRPREDESSAANENNADDAEKKAEESAEKTEAPERRQVVFGGGRGGGLRPAAATNPFVPVNPFNNGGSVTSNSAMSAGAPGERRKLVLGGGLGGASAGRGGGGLFGGGGGRGGGFLSGSNQARERQEEQEKLRLKRAAIAAEVQKKKTDEDRERLEHTLNILREEVKVLEVRFDRCQELAEACGKLLSKSFQQLEDDWAAAFSLKVVAHGYPIYFKPKEHDEMTAMMVASQLDGIVEEYRDYLMRLKEAKEEALALFEEFGKKSAAAAATASRRADKDPILVPKTNDDDNNCGTTTASAAEKILTTESVVENGAVALETPAADAAREAKEDDVE